MWKCNKCDIDFPFPELKRPDAGMVHARDIHGRLEIEPMRFCPNCRSVDIREVIGTAEKCGNW